MKISTVIHRVYFYLKYLISSKSLHSIHSPFLFQFIKECFDETNRYYDFEELDAIRKQMLNSNIQIEYKNIGAHSDILKHHNIPLKKIVKTAVSPRKYSELYYRIINFLQARVILELGTSVGLNTMYLAKAAKEKVITIEGQEALQKYAEDLFKKNRLTNIISINDYFDKALPQIIQQNELLDVVLIDGNHTYDATKRYYAMLKPQMNSTSVIIIDDIYWNKDMTKAWNEIIQDKDIKVSLNLYRCGIIIFNQNIRDAYHLLFRY